jgi:3-phosphoinositide dependent protein kinase-1
MEGESIIFDSPVEARTRRRRASRILLPTPVKSKRRHLVLTNRRLFCLKPNMTIKSELILRSSEKAKEKGKDSRGVIATVELRGEREFIVMAVSLPLRAYPCY